MEGALALLFLYAPLCIFSHLPSSLLPPSTCSTRTLPEGNIPSYRPVIPTLRQKSSVDAVIVTASSTIGAFGGCNKVKVREEARRREPTRRRAKPDLATSTPSFETSLSTPSSARTA
ncbi:hypothetical protein TEQG_00696 [Trichophyton equinum CBS 127.97]|uniref:Secreted protein n=1 Tax=Trichophyton equinum (strain ATCC MYA-4606 / CBS 127.97) TaxID=559882 RepID=F2PI88_TRIEC|nr:hypothetical protein TEQG_00696 [Trichophyton equinum CBS 127.97]